MAPLTYPHASPPTQGTDELLIELICADEDLLRAEFDAIIAAEWPGTAPGDLAGETAAERRPHKGRQRRRSHSAALAGRPRHLGIGDWARERSPPPTSTEIEHRNRHRKDGEHHA